LGAVGVGQRLNVLFHITRIGDNSFKVFVKSWFPSGSFDYGDV
jgi:hypothetical protein